MTPELIDDPLAVLKRHWGFDAFRPAQEPVVQAVLGGRDTLALLPTGGGKSLCYQVPALCMKGICIVVSPLIALMKDQVYQLSSRGVPAAAIFSGMRHSDIDRVLDNCVYGDIKLLYLSPERLTTELARERIARMHVNLLAVDEAHCISQWGYDFRPPYLQIAEIRALHPKTPVLALTATATPQVVDDIQERLEFKKKHVIQQSFARKEVAYVVFHEENKMQRMLDILNKVPGTAIVYVRNRKKTKEVATWLHRNRVSASYYHAGLDSETRSERQDAWIRSKVRVMVCTNAFGMGIDKPDVRVVIHLDLPDSPEAYFQEAGRAGRDRRKSYAVLLYEKADRLQLERWFELSFPDFTFIKRVYQALGSYFQLALGAGAGESFDFDLIEFARNFQLDVLLTMSALKVLEQSGYLVLTESVFMPASVQVIVSKEQMYDYQLRHPQADKVLKALLRSYAGAFMQPVGFREQQFAQALRMEKADLLRILDRLHKDNIVDYRPKRDKPQILFLGERVAPQHLHIDHAWYRERKRIQWERLESMFRYVEQAECRSQQLLRYFGELDAQPCGVCDVCLGRTEASEGDAFEQIKTRIQVLLQAQSMDESELLRRFPSNREGQVLEVLEFLLDERLLVRDTSARLTWHKTS
jgi:ATP-dependent DNA helicase RecQ